MRIGLSVRLMHPEATRTILPGKTLQYAESSLALWLQSTGAIVYFLPTPGPNPAAASRRMTGFASDLDGLILQGGADLAPQSYGEKLLRPEWAGDAARDRYELALFRAFARKKKPILGICRGCQLINVALGGTLYQDLATQLSGAVKHRHETRYDRNWHRVTFVAGSSLARLYPGRAGGRINSIHHQSIRTLGRSLKVEAFSPTDRVIEAVRGTGPTYLVGIQWHPEFITPADRAALPSAPLLSAFLGACRHGRRPGNPI